VAVTAKLYGKLFTALWNKEVDYDTASIKVALTTSIYTPDQDVHDYFNDVTNEVVGAGYSAGGVALGGKTVTYTAGTNKHTLDATDASWAAATITARTAVVYDAQTGVASTSPLICYQQETGDVVSSGGTFEVVWNASGIVEVTVA
jgi:hypothetical protein